MGSLAFMVMGCDSTKPGPTVGSGSTTGTNDTNSQGPGGTAGTSPNTTPNPDTTTSGSTSGSGSSGSTGGAYYYFPKLPSTDHLITVNQGGMSDAEQDMLLSLQGIVAKTKPSIYFLSGGSYQTWLDNIVKNHGVTTESTGDAWGLIDKFKGSLTNNGYILTDRTTESYNTAFSLAGVLGAVVVDKTIEQTAIKHGLTKALDVTGKSQKWALDNYASKLSKKVIFEQDMKNKQLRDYGAAVNGLFYYSSDTNEKATVLASMQHDSASLGWAAGDEFNKVGAAAQAGVFTIAADYANNLSALSAIQVDALKQHARPAALAAEDNVHYVTFVMTDGDNIQWLLNDFAFNSKWYGSTDRGKVPMAWMVSPSLADLAPSVVEVFYRNETEGDVFIGAVSGVGYFYPKKFPSDALTSQVQHLSDYLARLDIKYQVVMDDGMPSQATIDAYGQASPLKGGVIFTFGGCYADGKGQIMWSANGKPFVSVRLAMWDSQGPSQIAQQLNGQAKTPTAAAGYSIVVVHVWTHSYADVIQAVGSLNSNVRVVNIEDFFNQVTTRHAK